MVALLFFYRESECVWRGRQSSEEFPRDQKHVLMQFFRVFEYNLPRRCGSGPWMVCE